MQDGPFNGDSIVYIKLLCFVASVSDSFLGLFSLLPPLLSAVLQLL